MTKKTSDGYQKNSNVLTDGGDSDFEAGGADEGDGESVVVPVGGGSIAGGGVGSVGTGGGVGSH